MNSPTTRTPPDRKRIQPILARYQQPTIRSSAWQLATSFAPYVLLWVAMVLSLRVSYALTLLLAVPAAGFLVRIFIIFHDCGHGSFFRSRARQRHDRLHHRPADLHALLSTGATSMPSTTPPRATSTGAAAAMCGR